MYKDLAEISTYQGVAFWHAFFTCSDLAFWPPSKKRRKIFLLIFSPVNNPTNTMADKTDTRPKPIKTVGKIAFSGPGDNMYIY